MKKVLFKKWIPEIRETYTSELGNCYTRPKEGTRKFQDDFETEGLFLVWGLDTCEEGSFSVAIVQQRDGTIELVQPGNIKFL